MPIHPGAGRRAPASALVDVSALLSAYDDRAPDPSDPAQRVAFGTSGHRGSSLSTSFNDAHIVAISRAVIEYRQLQGVTGPLVLGADTHALSAPAFRTALEVLVAGGVTVVVQDDGSPVPTPVVSHAILRRNGRRAGLRRSAPPNAGWSDGIVITPSHNPPDDGGFKYNPPHGGPADADATGWIERRANELLGDVSRVPRTPFERALAADSVQRADLHGDYVAELGEVIDVDAIRGAGVRIGVDPMGGAGLPTWQRILERYGLDLTITNDDVDPRFAFMPLDHDGVIRMDCSSPHAMAGLLALAERFDVAFGNDPDADRHGIVTPAGLLPPNAYLAVAIDYLYTHRPGWSDGAAIGKTLVSSALIDRVAARLRRRVYEVPVGFKWFVPGLVDGSLAFGGEESAGATCLRRDGELWSTDKDGIAIDLLAAEILAVTGADPAERYAGLERDLGRSFTTRVDTPATPAARAALKALGPDDIRVDTLAGERIEAVMTTAPGNGAPIGGLKVVTEHGWFAARPSGTEDVSKLYAESFVSSEQLQRLVDEAAALIATVTA